MAVTPLDTLEQQVKNTAHNQLHAAQARLLRENSIVRMANAHMADYIRPPGTGERKKPPKKLRQGVYAQHAPDGYQRVSPVQEVQTAPGYRAAILRRAIGAVVAAAVVAALAALLFRLLL